jgi:hypothetical protein
VTFVGQTDNRRLLCRQQMSRLWRLALGQGGTLPSRQAVGEIREAANSVLAEVEAMAMSRARLEGGRRDPGAETFLWVRVNRLATTADQAVDAARRGDAAGLLAHLRRFETLTSAMWTVRDAI